MTVASRPANGPVSRAVALAPAVAPGPSMVFERTRRMRATAARRALVRETRLSPAQLVMPLFVVSGHGRREPIPSMPGQARLSPDLVVELAGELASLGVGGVMLFGIPDAKDDEGAAAADPAGPVPEAIRRLRATGVQLAVAADVCLCEYTTHGHCGIVSGDRIDNDATLPRLADAAVAYADAGADIVAPSGMMDGQVAAIRAGLDAAGLVDTAILAYASKHASALYGPFRDAADSTPAFGDRRSHQMDPGNAREALRELAIDAAEGADMLMVKPAITSLDLLARARQRFDLPLAAYQVSGELAMLEAAAERGWLDRQRAALELLTAIARAGADVILTYLARDAASWLATSSSRAAASPRAEETAR
jgi:porphobilinogen synthase